MKYAGYMKQYMILLVFISLMACSKTPSEGVIQTAIAETQVALPTNAPLPTNTLMPTKTQISYSTINLEPFLIQSGDLPIGYTAGQIRAKLSDFTKDAIAPDYFISQSLAHNGGMGGLVEVLVYEDPENVLNAYKIALSNLPGELKEIDVGEQGQAGSTTSIIITASIAFVRCHALVDAQFMGTSSIDDVLAYALRLDKRLQPLVCE